MSALEQEVIKKFYQLDDAAQQRVISFLTHSKDVNSSPSVSMQDWLAEIAPLNATFRAKYGRLPQGTLQELLDEAREESLDGLILSSWTRTP
jgi:hypothetical protein